MMHSGNIFQYILIVLVVILIAVSYYRFMVAHDYMVAYEGSCDPQTSKCFVGCDDDACTSKHYFAKIQKYAPNLYAQCGADITDCEEANRCLPHGDQRCSVTFCDSAIDGSTCETPDQEAALQTNNFESATSTPEDLATSSTPAL
jgi:hypothetical protein